MRNKKGFSLVETLAVIVILSIISLIVSPMVLNIIQSAQESMRVRSVESYAKAVKLAILSAEMDDSEVVLAQRQCLTETCINSGWDGKDKDWKYIEENPINGATWFLCEGFNNMDTYKKPDGSVDSEPYLTGTGVCYVGVVPEAIPYGGSSVNCGDMRYNRNGEGYLEMSNCKVGQNDMLYYYNDDPNPGTKYKMRYDHLPLIYDPSGTWIWDGRVDTYNIGARVPNKIIPGKVIRTGKDFVDWSPDEF